MLLREGDSKQDSDVFFLKLRIISHGAAFEAETRAAEHRRGISGGSWSESPISKEAGIQFQMIKTALYSSWSYFDI